MHAAVSPLLHGIFKSDTQLRTGVHFLCGFNSEDEAIIVK
jgi:hypothetical protein